MTFKQFKAAVKAAGWTVAQVRCDVPPPEALLDLIDRVGPDYERFATRYVTEEAPS
jgi:hypothetical protein